MNPDYAHISPWGQFVGAWIMFGLLGFIPAYIVAGILKAMGMLRIPERIELAGLDVGEYHDRFAKEADVFEGELAEARKRDLINQQ